MTKKLKLYVWEDVFWDYTPGLAFALATDAEEARRLLEAKMGYRHGDLARSPTEVTKPSAFMVHGGG